jgi:hypothetical protein
VPSLIVTVPEFALFPVRIQVPEPKALKTFRVNRVNQIRVFDRELCGWLFLEILRDAGTNKSE